MDELQAIEQLQNIETVKGKRAFWRSRITRLKAKLEENIDKPYQDLPSQDLNNLNTDLQREIKLHQALQQCYEALMEANEASEDELSEEMESSEEVLDQQRALQRSLDDLIQRHGFFQEALCIQMELENMAESTDPTTKIFGKSFKKITTRVNTTYLHQTIAYAEDDQLKTIRKALQHKLNKLSQDASEAQKKDKASEPTKESRITVTPVYHERSKFDIEMPTFSGKITDWQPFYELFLSTLESRGKHLNDKEKRWSADQGDEG